MIKPSVTKEMVAALLNKASGSIDDESAFCDRAQDVHDDLRDEAEKILNAAGITSDNVGDDELWDALVTELSEGVEWVPEHFQLTKSNA